MLEKCGLNHTGKNNVENIPEEKPKETTMSKDIWHKADCEPGVNFSMVIIQDTVMGYYYPCRWCDWDEKTTTIKRWCYLDDLLSLETELERTRKALDVAVDALDAGRTLARIAGFEMLATGMDEAIDKITTLEQKDK